MKHIKEYLEFTLTEAKKFGAKEIMKAFKNKDDWGDAADQVYMRGGNMVYVDTWFYGAGKAMKQLEDSWKKGGSNYDYWNKEYGVDFKIVDTFSEIKAEGRHKKLTKDGIVGVVLKVTPGTIDESVESIIDSIYEGAMGEIDLMAKEAKNLKEFTKEVFSEFKDLPKNRETTKWIEELYNNAINTSEKKKENFEDKIEGDGYYKGISTSTARDKVDQMAKQSNMSDDDPDAYKEMPGDTKGKKLLKKSKHTKSFDDLYGDETVEEKASGDRGKISGKGIETGLKKKSEQTGVSLPLLRIVMRRGLAAWKSGHRPGAGQEQWGYARVNSFLTKAPGTWGRPLDDPKKNGPKGKFGADADVAKEVISKGEDKKLKTTGLPK